MPPKVHGTNWPCPRAYSEVIFLALCRFAEGNWLLQRGPGELGFSNWGGTFLRGGVGGLSGAMRLSCLSTQWAEAHALAKVSGGGRI